MLVGNIHVLEGDERMLEPLTDELEDEGIPVRGGADAYVRTYRQMGVDDARELRERAWGRALSGRRVFIVSASFITSEAQNALLKTLEEPPSDALFFFIVASPSSLLPTLRSRMQTYRLRASRATETLGAEFLAAAPAERLEMLKPLLEKDDEDGRDTAGAIMLLSSLERMLGEHADDAAAREGLESVYRARAYLSDKGALVKPLLEQVALLTPRMRA